MRKPTKAIITDAGYASRYLPIAKTIPKGMLPIGNRPIMQLVVEECVAADIREIIIVATPEGKPRVEFFFQPNAKDGTSTQSLIEAWDGRGRPIPTDDVFAWLKAFAANKRKLVQFIKTGRPLILVERNGRRALVEYGSPLHRKLAPSQVAELKPLEANGRLD